MVHRRVHEYNLGALNLKAAVGRAADRKRKRPINYSLLKEFRCAQLMGTLSCMVLFCLLPVSCAAPRDKLLCRFSCQPFRLFTAMMGRCVCKYIKLVVALLLPTSGGALFETAVIASCRNLFPQVCFLF